MKKLYIFCFLGILISLYSILFNFIKILTFSDAILEKNYSNSSIYITILSGGIKTTKDETVVLLKSIFLKRTTDIVLNIATDEESKNFLERIFLNEMVLAYPRLTVNFKIVNLEEIKEKCDNLNIPIVHHSGLWGMSKLFLDEMFPTTNKTIFIDSDMILGSDPILLYMDFKKFDDETIFSLTRESNWQKKGPNHICSCIFLWDMEKSRNTRYLKKKGLIAAKIVFGYDKNNKYFSVKKRGGGDQDYFYAINYVFPNLFKDLNLSWNLSFCQRFFGVKPRYKHKDRSGLFFGAIHFNCLKNNFTDFKGWEWVIEYMIWYRWDWLNSPYSNYNLTNNIIINYL